MLAEFVEKIQSLTRPAISMVGLVPFSHLELEQVKLPEPARLHVSTLSSIVSYLQCGVDNVGVMMDKACSPLSRVVVHVAAHNNVQVLSDLNKDHLTRSCYMEASCSDDRFDFEVFQDTERFLISLQAAFVPELDHGQIVTLVSNLTNATKVTVADDGVSQQVTVNKGVSLQEFAVPLPRPMLTPYRTFPEVLQPSSQFVFRVRGAEGQRPTVALFPADGDQWKSTAMSSIAGFLIDKLPKDIPVIF